MNWKINKDGTKEHWLEVVDKDGWGKAICKWDGCIHYYQYGNISLNEDKERKDKDCCDDYIHICDLDEVIDDLIALREIARKHFAEHHYFMKSWGRRLDERD